MLGLSHVGTYLCLWPHHGHVPATHGGCGLWQLPCSWAAPIFSGSSHVLWEWNHKPLTEVVLGILREGEETVSCHMQSGDASTGNKRDCLPEPQWSLGAGPSFPLWRCSIDSDSVPWEDVVPVLTSVMMARDTEKPPSLQNMKAVRQTTEQGFPIPPQTSRVPTGWREVRCTAKWGPREDRSVLGGSKGSSPGLGA